MSATRKQCKKLLTADEARAELDRRGIAQAEFARQHNLPASTVYQVLAGHKKCLRGHAHKAAVLLGMKAGVIDDQPKAA
ncbi:MAG: DNA-binding protein [Pseudomonadota bacterium]|nr:DNA-binding protein [Pseudomonadota bacterium]